MSVLFHSRRQLMRNSNRSDAWHKRYMPPPTGSLVAGMVALAVAMPAGAATLDELATVSAVGEPLRFEIRAPGIDGEVARQCLRVTPLADVPADTLGLSAPKISALGSGAQARIRISGDRPVFEPIVQVIVENHCGAHLRREYTLLLAPPLVPAHAGQAASSPARSAHGAAGTRTAPSPPAARQWVAVQGESVDSIAAALYPDDAGARHAFVTAVREDNRQLFRDGGDTAAPLPAGTAFTVPGPARLAAASTQRAVSQHRRGTPTVARVASAAGVPTVPATAAGPARARPASEGGSAATDRLVLQGDEAPNAAATDAAAGADARRREERLVAAIDRTISLELEIAARIRRLEEIQLALKAALDASELAASLPPARAVAVATTAGVKPPEVASDDAIPERDGAPAAAPVSSPAPAAEWMLVAALIGALGAGAGVLAARRGRASAGAAAPLTGGSPVGGDAPPGAPATPALARTPSMPLPQAAPPASVQNPSATAAPAAAAIPATSAGGIAVAELPSLPPPAIEDETVEEHDSAVELAEIMMSFGRVQGAAEMLAEFIQSNPKQAITPWLKLMEVYRVGGMRAEFDALAKELNHTFNVQAVTWNNFEEARNPENNLERMPHIVDVLTRTWGTRECQAYLEKILRDNRDGTRQGFMLGVIDDILMLAGVLEQHLGRHHDDA